MFIAGQWSPAAFGLAIGETPAGAILGALGLATYFALVLLQLCLDRKLFFVACPICGARSSSAAWTTSLSCDCPRCSRVYASGFFFLRFFSARRVTGAAAGKDSA
jgi:hypothetical protein